MAVPSARSFHLRLFGAIEVRSDAGAAIRLPTERSRKLLAIVALENGAPVRRERLGNLLWTEIDDERLGHAVATELWRVKRALAAAGERAESWLEATGAVVRFKTDAGPCVDALAFLDLAARARTAEPGEAATLLDAAAEIYRADLLADLTDDWALLARESFRDRLVGVLERRLALARDAAAWPDVIRVGKRILAEDSFLEHVHREIMRAHELMGDRAAALRHFASLRDNLERELGVAPTPDTLALYALLQDATAPSPSAAASRPPGADEARELRAIQHELLALAGRIGRMAEDARPS